MYKPAKHFYEFGPFRLDTAEHLLWRDDETVPLTPKAYETLVVLVEHSGHVVEKNELMKQIWPETFVEEANLAHNISLLRRALGDGLVEQQYIQTVPKRGYRFIADVREVDDEGAEEPVSQGPLVLPNVVEESRPAAQSDDGIHSRDARLREDFGGWTARHKAVVSILALALPALIGVALYFSSKPQSAAESLAVLPFANGSADPQAEYLSDGITESLINKLSQLPGLQVKARTTVFRYKGQEHSPQQIGRDLGVETVLTGKVVQRADALIIQADLVRVADGSQLWGAQYNRRPADIFAVQEEISRKIVEALRLRLSGEDQQQLTKRYTENTEAYHCYLKGRYLMDKRSPATIEKSVEYFERATRMDPNYALAYADLSLAYTSLGFLGVRPPMEVMPEAKRAVNKSLELDDTLADAHISLGFIMMTYDWDWSAAEREFKHAIELSPNSGRAHEGYAHYLKCAGRFDESIGEIRRALELEPASALINRNVAMMLYFARQYDQAIEQCHKTLELDPNMPTVYGWLGRAYEQKRLYEQAVEAYLKGREVSVLDRDGQAALREAYAKSGWKGYWLKELDLEKEKAKRRYVTPYRFAVIYARLGEKDQALVWLEKACEDHQWMATHLNVDPVLDDLRSDPRFTRLLQRTGLAP